jgi:uncharacterized damage-inducible protein DinB
MTTNDLSTTVAAGFASYYEDVRRRLHELVDPLTDEQLWRRPYPYGNSVGHLVLHLTGNLNYYVGAQIARSGYVRDRPREFMDTESRPKEQVLAAFDAAVALVMETLQRQSPDDWREPYTAVGERDCDRFTLFLRCAGHAYHHVGQMIYLRKQLELAPA